MEMFEDYRSNSLNQKINEKETKYEPRVIKCALGV